MLNEDFLSYDVDVEMSMMIMLMMMMGVIMMMKTTTRITIKTEKAKRMTTRFCLIRIQYKISKNKI